MQTTDVKAMTGTIFKAAKTTQAARSMRRNLLELRDAAREAYR